MTDPHTALMGIVSLVVTVIVPAVVWLTVLGGVYQLAREEVHRVRMARPSASRLVPRSHQVS